MAAKFKFALFLLACVMPIADAVGAECTDHAELKYRTIEDNGRIIDRTTYCACVAGYSNQGGVCKPVATHNWRVDLPKLAHDAEAAAGNNQPAPGANQR